MLSSIHAGVSSLAQTGWAAGARSEIRPVATLIALGDQPQARPESVRQILEAFGRSRSALILPSYERRRGHPWLVRSELWPDLLAMQPPATARDFLYRHSDEIEYVAVDSPTILQDVDTPADYEREKPP
jgi:molybdenum cofactor cytidylyltransferase